MAFRTSCPNAWKARACVSVSTPDRWRVQEVLAIALDIARGLAAAHARSIIHRDLKPENTFLSLDGGVKILDFGLAKLQMSLEGVPTGAPGTITGVILGTAGYMAPEQVKGENVDTRADLFALGVMVYEMLCGQHPFRKANTFESLHAVLTINPPDLSSVNAQVPASLGRIVMRLLEKAPEARFQSALDVVWALEQVDTGVRGRSIGSPTLRRFDAQVASTQRGVGHRVRVRRAPAPYRLDTRARDISRSARPRIDAVYLAAAIRNGTWFRPDGFAGWPADRFRGTE